MEDYKIYIQNLADKKANVLFYNSGPNHAALVMSAIFSHSTKTVKIYAGDLNGGVSKVKCYHETLDAFLEKGGNVQILLNKLRDSVTLDAQIFNLLRYHKLIRPESVDIRRYNGSIVDKRSSKEIHFTIGSQDTAGLMNMYRLEDNIEEFTATGNFNDPSTAGLLELLFNEIYSDPNKTSSVEL